MKNLPNTLSGHSGKTINQSLCILLFNPFQLLAVCLLFCQSVQAQSFGTSIEADHWESHVSAIHGNTRPDDTANKLFPTPLLKPIEFEEFGGQTGFGIGFGDGLIAAGRYCLSAKTAFEAGIGLGSTHAPLEESFIFEENPYNTELGVQIEGAAHLMGARKENHKGKIKANGIMLRASHLFGDFATSSLSAGYGVEVFNPIKKKPSRSYLFEVGLKASFPQWETNSGGYGEPYPALPYLRFRWFWYGEQKISTTIISPTKDPVEQVQPLQPDISTGDGESAQNIPIQRKVTSISTSSSGILKKGNFMVATATGLAHNSASSTGGRNMAGISHNDKDGVKTTIIGLTPNAGYFFSDNLLGGVSISAVTSTEKKSNRKETSSLLLLGPFIRYYGNLPANDQLKWTAEASIGFGRDKVKIKTGNQVFENVDGLFSISLGPGIAYFISDRVTLEGQALYERLSIKDKETNEESSAGSFGLRIGLGVFL